MLIERDPNAASGGELARISQEVTERFYNLSPVAHSVRCPRESLSNIDSRQGQTRNLDSKIYLRDSIVSNSNSTASLRRLFQQHRSQPVKLRASRRFALRPRKLHLLVNEYTPSYLNCPTIPPTP